jgi:hypothetical protein
MDKLLMTTLQLFLTKPYDSQAIISQIPLNNGGITEATLAIDTKNSYILKLVINPNLGTFYDALREENNSGVRLRQLVDGNIDLELAFVKDRQPQINRASGRVELSFRGASYLLTLNTLRKIPYYKSYNGSCQQILQDLSPNFVFQLFGADDTISIQTGTLDPLQLVNEAIEATGNFIWWDYGVDTYTEKPIIGFGNPSSLPTVATARYFEDDEPFDQTTIRIVGEPKQNLNGDSISHLLATGTISSGTGADRENTIFLDNPSADYIFADYPLVWLGEVDDNNKPIYRIYNPAAYAELGYNRLQSYSVDLSSNSTDPTTGTQDFDYKASQKTVYRRAVNYLRSKGFGSSYTFDYRFPKIYPAGTKILLDYRSVHKLFGVNRDIIRAEGQEIYLKNIEYDLTRFL